jgi:oxygen-independent coproporphyrinogen-3 oxidase
VIPGIQNIQSLLEKFDTSGPRYTSYPTAPQFHTDITHKDWEIALQKSNESNNNISLYFHIPFCHSLCFFCGCNMQVTRNQALVESYLNHLFIEMEMITKKLDSNRTVSQIHFGGGTPNFLNPHQIIALGEKIHSIYNLSNKFEFSCEIDPRTISLNHVEALMEIGVNRISIGIQDFDMKVQESVNRVNSYAKVKKVQSWFEKFGINKFNFDLIYGLPLQDLNSFSKTLNKVIKLNPSRIATYNFAYLPSLKPHHKLINENELPPAKTKIKLLELIIQTLSQNGYTYIGMDHFAKNDDELIIAQQNGTLQRNFQGYSTQKETDLFAFGVSSISSFGGAFFQNYKGISTYTSNLESSLLPVEKGYICSTHDKLIQNVISSLMCNLEIDFQKFSQRHKINFTSIFDNELAVLASEFEGDGLIEISPQKLSISKVGRLFIRNIAMVFDQYIKTDKSFYSKTI